MNRNNLHPFQANAIDFITEKQRCCLWIFLGGGKTVITLTAIDDMLNACIIKKAIIIAPLRVCTSTWPAEIDKWEHLSDLTIAVATGSAQKRKDALNSNSDITLINKENTQWLVDLCAKKKRWSFDCVIIDEMSAFKNSSSKRFRKLKKIIPHTKVMVGLTGTPSPAGLMDIWSQMYLIDEGKALGKTITGYRQQFFTPDWMGYNWEIKDGSAEKIHSLIKPLVLSLQDSDYVQLPERLDLVVKVALPPKAMEQYVRFEKDLFLEFQDVEIEAMSAAVLSGRLLQMANGAIYIDEEHNWKTVYNAKLDALGEILDDNPDENVIVSFNFHHDHERIIARFPHAVMLDKDPNTIERWNNGEIKLMLCHPQSASFGLNLQKGGSMLIFFSLTWSLENYQQMAARLHRQGQEKPVRIVHLIAQGTIDERVMRVLGQKNAVQNDLLNALRG